MNFLVRHSSGSRSLLLPKTNRLTRISNRPPKPFASHLLSRCASSVAQIGGQCTIVNPDFSIHPQTSSRSPSSSSPPSSSVATSLEQLQLSPAILTQLQQHIETTQPQDAFYVVDTSAVEERFKLWTQYLPHVRPFYAVKCNPDAQLIQSLARLGCGFDCASSAEISSVLQQGVSPEDIIYANPCKQGSHIAFAASQRVNTMTFDCTDELTKIHAINPHAELVLRLYVDDTKAICRLGTKFGAMVHDVPAILAHAQDLHLNVTGVSFHVGSGCFNVSAYSDAVARAKEVFDIAERMGVSLSLLDIGGGFPGTATAPVSFEDCARELQTSLATHFPESSGVRIISEPGRFFAASTHTLAVNVIGRKVAPVYDLPGGEDREPTETDRDSSAASAPNYMYFVNDGLYGSFNCLVYDHSVLEPVVPSSVMMESGGGENLHPASVWGPTCDGMDCVMKEVKMPVLNVGQWIYFPSMGAYTCAASSDFNGFAPPQKIYFDGSEQAAGQQEQEVFVH